jgi:hypothetical protein
MPLQYVTSLRKHELRRKSRIEQPLTPIAAELINPNCCDSLGSVGKGNSPVLGLCRFLLAAGFNPDQALDVYRTGTPALPVKSPRAGGFGRPIVPVHVRVPPKTSNLCIVDNGEASLIPHSRAPVAGVAACNPLSCAPKHAVGRHRHSTSTAFQLLLPFVTYCGRFPGICPLTDRSFIADPYCYRCGGIAPGSFSAR